MIAASSASSGEKLGHLYPQGPRDSNSQSVIQKTQAARDSRDLNLLIWWQNSEGPETLLSLLNISCPTPEPDAQGLCSVSCSTCLSVVFKSNLHSYSTYSLSCGLQWV